MEIKQWLSKIDFGFAKQKWFRITIVCVLSIFLIGLFWGLSVRGKMLDRAVVKVKEKLKSEYGLDLHIGDYRFAGLTTVAFENVSVTPDSAERLASIEEFKATVRLLPLITGDVEIGSMVVTKGDFTLVKHDSSANYDFMFSKNVDTLSKADTEVATLAEKADHIIKQVFLKIPSDLTMKDVKMSYQDSSGIQSVRIPSAEIDNGDYDVNVFLNQSDANWNFKGEIDRKNQSLDVKITASEKNVEIPFLNRKLGLVVSFDELSFRLDGAARKSKDVLEVLGGWSVKNLHVFHKRLSAEDIVLPEGDAQGGILISENTLQLIEGSKVHVKDFVFQPKLKFSRKPKKILSMAVHTGRFRAQNFFDAIPKGLFENLDGLEVDGDISYDMEFEIDIDDPDGLKFTSKVDDADLTIKKWGKANIAALNQPFLYDAFDDTTKLREIMVGPENPNFTPISRVSSILKKTVLNTEDPFFYEHKGFELEAFQLSIITNIKEKKFKRGASTISMQLIKNLYLNRNKTMMRKFEEILLVWLMEQSKQVSKDRLFEIYLNVIEWGKGVYGISEAAKYYFGKTPSEITLGESLFLSSIIPRPKTGLSSFDYTGGLKPWLMKHFNTYGYIMNKRGQLEGEDVPANYGFYQVQVLPSLRPPKPKGVADSTASFEDIKNMADEMDKEERLRRTLMERLFGPIEKKETQN